MVKSSTRHQECNAADIIDIMFTLLLFVRIVEIKHLSWHSQWLTEVKKSVTRPLNFVIARFFLR